MKKILFFGKKHFHYYSLLALLLLPLLKVSAQVSLATMGAAYTQDFNTLASSGTSSVVPTGWAFQETGGNTLYSAGTGSVSTGDTYSFGSLSASDRAFGTLLSGSVTSTLGVSFTNNTGSTITSLDISYIGEEWRLGTASRTDQLNFEYSLNATSLTSGTWTGVSALNFITPNTTTVVGAVNGNVTGNRTSISSTIGSLSIASGATIWIRWTDFNASGADDGLGIDDFSLTPNGAAAAPTKLAITSISPASPIAGNAFSITVQAQDGSNVPQNVSANTAFALSTNGNAGTLGGTLTGTITAGQNSVVISGLTLPSPGTGVNLTATRTSGDVLTAGTSANFTVVGVATKVVFVGVPSTGFTSSNLTTFTVEAQRADNSVDVNYNGTITVSKASGPGTLSGTTSTTAVNGIATFSDLQFDQVGTYALSASSGTLSPSTSSSIVISQSPVTWNFGTSTGLASPSSGTPYANLTVSNMLQGNNNGTTTMLTSSTASSGYAGASGNFNAGAAARVGAINTAANGSAYFEFSLTPDPGYYVTLNGISFGSRSTGTGPAAFSIRSSNDNYVSNLGTGSLSTGSTWAIQSPSFSSTSSTAGTTITFRIYGHSGTGSPSAGTANWKIDDVVLNLSVQQCTAPTITVNSGAICTGNSFTITPNGGVSYTVTGGSYTVSPTSNTSYTVTGADVHGCTNTAVSSVTVNSLPNVVVNSGAICTGNSFTMNPTGAVSYVYSSGTNVVSPTANTDYTVTGTDANGCSNTAVSSVTVNSLPTVSITASPSSICSGSSSTLTASGATSYVWNTGETTSSITVSPTGTTGYTVTGVDGNGCSNTAVSSVTVNSLPTVSITASPSSICSGSSSTLTASGATSYVWNTGETTTAITVSPTGNTSYTVTGVDGNGCSNTDVISITVNALPSVSISANPASVCSGYTSTLTASGALSYLWNTGESSATIMANPTTNTSYTVTGIGANGCANSSVKTVTVISCSGTQLSPSSCGITLTALDQNVSFMPVTGATNYRLEIINSQQPFNAVNVRNTNTTTFKMSWIDGIQYDRTYNIRVAAYVSGAWQAYGNTCTVTTPSVIPTTQLSAGSCNITLNNLNQILNFDLIPGATNYRFEIVNAAQSFSVVNVRNNTVSTFNLSWVSGVQYGRTYNIRIAAYVNGVWQAYGNTCTVTTPSAIPTTQLSAGSCNITLNNLNQTLNFDLISGATNYRFEIVNAAQSFSVVNVRNNTVSTFNLSWVSGVQYGRTYDIRISAYINNVWQPYGGICSITTPSSIPLTQLSSTVCNTSVATRGTVFNFDPVAGASNYRLLITNSSQPLNVTNTRNTTSTNFALSYVTGTQVGLTYDISVAAQVGGVWGSYGQICQVTALSAKDYDNSVDFANAKTIDNNSMTIEQDLFGFNLYPNPNNGLFTIELNATTQIIITDALGQIVLNETMNSGKNNVILQNQSGIYFVKLIQNNKQQVIKLIKD